ncbi:MAG: hypothetical protein DWQ36_02680 [Acidobacteria bacterium]|nr:MAG: hypothetical protein DWQ30_24070 [Acidobacteriota bacterium]REK11342.1 MAG: hypothetical protein DWQ36_02680 [Acidobacteriota bacterium]
MQISERERIARAVTLCRENRLEDGYALLKHAAIEGFPKDSPSAAYSYLGYGMAVFEARYNDGVAACQRALEVEFYQPENYWNLARTYLLLGARRKAVQALNAGLRVDPGYAPLLRLRREMGSRKRPVLRFLRRDHWLNRMLGSVRHELKKPPQSRRNQEGD